MKQEIIKIIQSAVEKLIKKQKIELTKAKKYGDYSTNIALKLANKLGKKPQDIANEIKSNINSKLIEKVEISEAGFINILINKNIYKENVTNILKMGADYGKGKINKKINIEFVSANPTGYLHIGHARNAILGDSLSKLLSFAGYNVETEYWLNDSGNQINILTEAVFLRYKELFGQKIIMPKDTYKGQDIIECAKFLKASVFFDDYKNSSFEEVFDMFTKASISYMINEIKNDLKSIGVEIKLYTSEKEIILAGNTEKTIKKLKKYTYKKDGALWLATEKLGDDKDRVIIKDDGVYTYFAPDIAGHQYKINRGYDELINVFGKDHIGYGPRLKAAVEMLGLPQDKFDIVFMEMVSLFKNGKALKMSKRSGTSFTIKEITDILDIDTIRYFLISRSNRSPIEIDIEKVKLKNNDNPVHLIKYSYARACQILFKGKKEFNPGQYDDREIEIIKHLNYFPELIENIAKNHNIHKLPAYLLELSRLYNSFYSNTRIISTDKESKLLALTKAVQVVLKNGLKLIGVSTPEKI